MNEFVSTEIQVRRMLLSDIYDVAKLSIESGIVSWGFEDYKKELEERHSFSFVAVAANYGIGSQIPFMGFLLARLVLPEIEILNIAVSEQFRRKKVGSFLIDRLIHESEKIGGESIWLEVRASNLSAIGLYLKKGFCQVGKRCSYYTEPVEDAFIMSRKCICC